MDTKISIISFCVRTSWLAKMKEMEHKNLSQFLPLLASLFLGSNTAQDVKVCTDILILTRQS